MFLRSLPSINDFRHFRREPQQVPIDQRIVNNDIRALEQFRSAQRHQPRVPGTRSDQIDRSFGLHRKEIESRLSPGAAQRPRTRLPFAANAFGPYGGSYSLTRSVFSNACKRAWPSDEANETPRMNAMVGATSTFSIASIFAPRLMRGPAIMNGASIRV